MKKIISAILVLALTILAIPHIVVASDGTTPSFSLSTVEGVSDDTVHVNLDVMNNPGITAFQIQIGYSAENVELVSVEDKKLFGDAISFGRGDANPFTISWFSSDSKDMYNNGTLAVLEFRIKNGAESSALTLSYEQENVFNIELTSIPFQTIDGKVIVTPKSIETATPKPTETATLRPIGMATPKPEKTTAPNPVSSSAPQSTGNKDLSIGASVKDANGVVYKVISADTVEYSKPAKFDNTKVSIPATVSIDGISYKVTSIAKRTFSGDRMLKTVTIGKNVETIGANAFYNCKKLKKITIPQKVKKVGVRAFANCKKLKAETVGKQAFKSGYLRPTVKVPPKYKSMYKEVLRTRGMSKYAIYK